MVFIQTKIAAKFPTKLPVQCVVYLRKSKPQLSAFSILLRKFFAGL